MPTYRLKTDVERQLHDEVIALQEQITDWKDYAIRLRQEREDLRRALASATIHRP